MEQNLEEACVYIYAAMGLYEESVDLALKVGYIGGLWGCGVTHMCLVRWRMLNWPDKWLTPH